MYARALATPLAVCLLPVMIGALVGVLEGYRLGPYVWWACGAAFLLANGWTSFHLQTLPAELHLQDGYGALLTVWECAHRSPPEWHRILDMRDYGRWCFVTIGLSSFHLEGEDWEDFSEIKRLLAITDV